MVNWYARYVLDKNLLIIDFAGVNSKVLNSSGWGAIVMHAVFATGFGYFIYKLLVWCLLKGKQFPKIIL